MTARWDHLPPKARVAKPRRKPVVGRYRCAGPNGCGEVTEGTYAKAERHADEHGGAGIETLLP